MKFLKQGALALAAAAVLTACGGGGGQIEPFKPTRIMAFGDEASVITSEGRKYMVNALTSTDALDCAVYPLWTQSLASAFGLVFPECNPNKVASPTGKIYATAGAKVAGVKAQVDAAFGAGGVDSKTLITVMVGTHDVLELYAQFPAQSRDALMAQAGQRGRALAEQVNRIANADGRVLVATIPDVGLTPFALKERQSKNDIDRAKLLADLTAEFNGQMRGSITNDGRRIGLVLGDTMSQSLAKFPSSIGATNVADPACLESSLPIQCTPKTLVAGATASSHLWATSLLMSAGGQGELGRLAVFRASQNPF